MAFHNFLSFGILYNFLSIYHLSLLCSDSESESLIFYGLSTVSGLFKAKTFCIVETIHFACELRIF